MKSINVKRTARSGNHLFQIATDGSPAKEKICNFAVVADPK